MHIANQTHTRTYTRRKYILEAATQQKLHSPSHRRFEMCCLALQQSTKNTYLVYNNKCLAMS